jgi:hypothetical protein
VRTYVEQLLWLWLLWAVVAVVVVVVVVVSGGPSHTHWARVSTHGAEARTPVRLNCSLPLVKGWVVTVTQG